MTAHAHNPVILLLRAVGVAAIGLLVYATWSMGSGLVTAVTGIDGMSASQVIAVLLLILTCGAIVTVGVVIAWKAVRQPRRYHLIMAVVAAVLVLHALATHVLETMTAAILDPDVFKMIRLMLFWVPLLVYLPPAVAAEWWLAKRAGFIDPTRRWWTAPHIRSTCAVMAAIWGLGGFALLSSETGGFSGIVVERFRHVVTFGTILTVLITTAAIALYVPRLLMKLTGVPDELRAESGFRLY